MAHRAGSDGASIVSAKPIEKPGCQSWEGGDSGGTRLNDKLIVLPKRPQHIPQMSYLYRCRDRHSVTPITTTVLSFSAYLAAEGVGILRISC
jgi:hypothetical protein